VSPGREDACEGERPGAAQVEVPPRPLDGGRHQADGETGEHGAGGACLCAGNPHQGDAQRHGHRAEQGCRREGERNREHAAETLQSEGAHSGAFEKDERARSTCGC
jgi:hypothetical protein